MAPSANRFKSGGISFGTRNFDKLFDDRIKFNANAKFDKEATQTIANYRRDLPKYSELTPNRSIVDRGFDLLLGANYVVAGAVDGLVRDDRTVLGGIADGFRAANPFGGGYKSGETTFSDVIRSTLDRQGKDHPDTLLGKIAVGTAGFTLDVLLDPTTYLTFGTSAILKGSGKVGKAAQTIDTLAKANPEFAKGLREAGELTDDLAQEIVMKANGISSFDEIASSSKAFAQGTEPATKIGADQFRQEVDELKRTYNSLLGVGREPGRGISFGLQNGIFGETVARKLGITARPVTLIGDAPLRQFSDATGLSRAYSASREAFYGSKLGELLSRNAGLKHLADADPAKLFEYVGAVSKAQGKDLDQLAKDVEIRKIGETLLDLSPSQQKKIINALHNPSLFSKVKDIIKGPGTNTWLKLEGEYRQTADNLKTSIAEAKRISADLEDANVAELTRYREEVAQLTTYKNNTLQQQNTLKAIDTEIGRLIKEKEAIEAPQVVKDYDSIIKSIDSEIKAKEVAKVDLEAKIADGTYAPFKDLDNPSLNKIVDDALSKVTNLDVYNKLVSETAPVGRINKVLERQSEVTALRTALSDLVFGEPNAIPANIGFDKLKSIADAIKRSDNPDASYGALLGDTGGYNFASFAKGRRELGAIVRGSTDPLDVIQKVLKSETLVGGSDTVVYNYLASKYGYNNVADLRNRMADLRVELQIQPNGRPGFELVDEISQAKFNEFTKISNTLRSRQSELDEIFKIADPKERVRFVQKLKDSETEQQMNEILFGNIDAAKLRDDIILEQSGFTEEIITKAGKKKVLRGNEYAGTKYDRKLNIEDQTFAQQARSWGEAITPEAAEIRRMRESRNDRPYTYDEIAEHSTESIKTSILQARTKALLSQGLSPQAKAILSRLNNKGTEVQSIQNQIKRLREEGALTKESATRLREQHAKALNEFRVIKEEAESTTNLITKRKQAQEITPEDLKTLGAQLQASLQIQHRVFPNFRFDDLTTSQKNLITGSAYSATRSFIQTFGLPNKKKLPRFTKWVEDKAISDILKRSSEATTKRSETLQIASLLDKVTYESGVEFKQGAETLRGIVQGIKEDTVTKFRETVDVRFEPQEGIPRLVNSQRPLKDKKGKPILNADGTPKFKNRQIIKYDIPEPKRIETVTKTPFEEKTGAYTYDILTPDGKLVSVKSSDIVGTYDDAITSSTYRIPEHVQSELDRIDDEIRTLKNQLRGNKAAKTRQAKTLASKTADIDAQVAELTQRKIEEEGLLNSYKELTDQYKTRLLEAFPGSTTFSRRTPGTPATRTTEQVTEFVDEVVQDTPIPSSPLPEVIREKASAKSIESLIKSAKGDDSKLKDARFVRSSYNKTHDKLTRQFPESLEDFSARSLDDLKSDRDQLVKYLRGNFESDDLKNIYSKFGSNKYDQGESLAELDFAISNFKAIDSIPQQVAPTTRTVQRPVTRTVDKVIPGTPAGIEKVSVPNGEILTESALIARQQQALNNLNESIVDMVAREAQITKALDDNEAFEMLIKLDLGDDGYAKLYNKSAQEVDSASGDLVIDRLTDWDKNIIDMTKLVREQFKKAGLDEVAVGKLDKGAFDELAERYFPRTLSEDGKKFFDDNPDLVEKYSAVSNLYGFGRKFNQYTLSRSDELRNKTISEVNDYFQSEVGVRIFEENLGKAFLNRMMTSSEMVYDQRAMQYLTHNFGHPVRVTRKGKNNFKEGYSRVINYGTLKQVVRDKVLAKYKLDYKGVQHTKEEFDTITEDLANQLITRAGLDPKILLGETTPIIKLEDSQVQRVARALGVKNIRQVNNLTVERLNQVRKLTLERDSNRLVQLYDKFLTFFKLNQTTIMPSFHFRNHVGNMFNGWLHVGSEALSISKQKEAFDALKAYGDGKTLRELPKIVTENGRTYDYEEILDLAQTYKVLDNGLLAKDFSSASYSKGTRVIPGKFDPFNTAEFAPYKIGSKIATYSDNISRLSQFAALIKQGKTPAEAAAQTTKYLFDYSDVTAFEARWMKRILPYYTFMRKNIPLMANQFIDNPEKLQFIAKLGNLPEGAVNPEDRVDDQFKTGFAQDYIQLPFNVGGGDNAKPALFNPALPIQQLRDINTQGNIGEQARTLFSQSTPIAKVPFEISTNWNSFFDDEIAREDGPQITPRVVHALSQLAGFNAVKNFVSASDMDSKFLALLNSGTGIKISGYDVERAKEKVYEDAYSDEFQLTIRNIIGTGVRIADSFSDRVSTNVSDIAVKLVGAPYRAEDETGVLAPISGKSYEEFSDEQKKLYTFDEKTKSYVNNRAIEFEREQYEKTGILKKFAWMLIKDDGLETTTVRVDRVKDGDTFVANQNGTNFDVRLLLVDTPESVGEYSDNPQLFGQEASNRTKDMILGKDVKLYLDKKDTTYGRRLAFVEVGGVSLQETLVSEGLGKVREYNQNYTDRAEGLYNLEEEAYKKKKGVFSKEGNAVPRSNTGFQY